MQWVCVAYCIRPCGGAIRLLIEYGGICRGVGMVLLDKVCKTMLTGRKRSGFRFFLLHLRFFAFEKMAYVDAVS
jgi:hypothetical protein